MLLCALPGHPTSNLDVVQEDRDGDKLGKRSHSHPIQAELDLPEARASQMQLLGVNRCDLRHKAP